MQITSCKMLGWMTQEVESRFWEKHQQPQICRWYHSNGRKPRGTKEPLDEDERGEWKAGLKLNVQKTKIMASGPITSWQRDGEKMETVRDFIFLGSKITADGDCSHEIKRRLLLGRKAMINLDSKEIKPVNSKGKAALNIHIRWPKYWSFSFSIGPSDEYSGLIPFRMDWFGSPCGPRDSQESSPTPQFKSIYSSPLSFLYSPTHIHTWLLEKP